MLLSDFDYDLPGELVAQRPLDQRDAARMMLIDRRAQTFEDRLFYELPEILRAGDVLVLNNTKVFPARLLGRRKGTRAQTIGKNNPKAREFLRREIELLLTRFEGEDVWCGLVRPGRKVRTGEVMVFGDDEMEAQVLGRGEYGLRRVRLRTRQGTVEEALARLGHMPLPPYLSRPDDASDRKNYQTVYAKIWGAVAAPTAGLHFTPRMLEALRQREIEICEVTLHVGPGTFRPVRSQRIEEHKMDAEWYNIPPKAAATLRRAASEGRRVFTVGTTCIRTLEHVANMNGGAIVSGSGETLLFITPQFQFQVANGLLTNFHLPRSTPLMLVSAFAGHELTLGAYRHAIAEHYRFYSYGDCMLIV
ncbi:MAG TPA: tRNA preQ1(34) S-adenosylmethionine ribosyltransferase-isomerase QueA [Terriglobia bacterium]|nr:tRNA preQ1(34) S-adenosylmethionine ribosyltransferase-isomerase QueA [Terriglobia bacterium]